MKLKRILLSKCKFFISDIHEIKPVVAQKHK